MSSLSAAELKLVREFVSSFVGELLRRHRGNVVSVVLFGSLARGNFRRTSDIDLLIVMRGLPKSRLQRYKLIADAIDGVEGVREELARAGVYTGISPVILSVEEAKRFRPLYLDLIHDSEILYDKGGFFSRILRRVAELVAEFGGERVWVGRRWYWVFRRRNPFTELCGARLVD